MIKAKEVVLESSFESAVGLRPLLEECGYTGSRLAVNYDLNGTLVPFVGFASKPWDFDSACIAILEANGDAERAARSCYDLAAPVLWVRNNGSVDWWVQHATTPTLFATCPIAEFPALVRQHQRLLDPISVYRGKTIARIDKSRQLDFVDIGLMPLRREQAGKKLGDLVEEMTRVTLAGNEISKDGLRDVFTSVFRLLAGKILKDKAIGNFTSVDLTEPEDVLSAVAAHYDTNHQPLSAPASGYSALEPAAKLLAAAGSFKVVSPESLAYVYEHTLVSKPLRKKLGIHATPPWLVDYIVWQLYDWICEIPREERQIFEPACGHAPFLLSVMRLLRLEMQDVPEGMAHAYLKAHIHGFEVDDFAREIARLSLTLADIPNPDGWDIIAGDMYETDLLAKQAADCRVLLSNPPYEKFSDEDKVRYAEAGQPVASKKAVELLHRTLKQLRAGSVFGVVVPQTVITGPEGKSIRDYLLREFEIAEVCLFPGKVFEIAQIETATIIGRRCREGQVVSEHRVRLRTVGEHGINAFRQHYTASNEATATQAELQENPALELKLPALAEVWRYLEPNTRIGAVASIGRGIEYKGIDARKGIAAVVTEPEAGYASGYSGVSHDQTIVTAPPECWIATRLDLISNPRQGQGTGVPQILINMARTARSPWRIKAMLDDDGKPVKNNFATVRPQRNGDFGLYLWAILNSPVANAFVASRTMRKHNYEGILREIPLPRANEDDIRSVIHAARQYREMALKRAQALAERKTSSKSVTPLFDAPHVISQSPTDREVCEALLVLDATVLRLYALPVRHERQLLDYFSGHVRQGVVCTFGDYYPTDYKSLLALHKFISSGYRKSAVDQVADQMKPSDSSPLTAALRAATEAFGGD